MSAMPSGVEALAKPHLTLPKIVRIQAAFSRERTQFNSPILSVR